MTRRSSRIATSGESTYPSLVVTKYMGSKKAILPFVAAELERLTQPGDIVVDLMAGTHTIGFAMKRRCRMVANDIQHYSRVIGHTLLNYVPKPRFEGAAHDAFRRYYQFNQRHLEGLFEPGLRAEAALLEAGDSATWQAYRNFCENYPHYLRPERAPDWEDDFLLLFGKPRVEAYRALNKLEPYNLFSLYYANSYVGIRQALEMDSLRFAVDKFCDEWIPDHEEEGYDSHGMRCLLISVLVSLLNRVNPGPGHWAAFPRVSERNCDWLVTQRSIPLFDQFFSRVAEFETFLARHESPFGPHVVSAEDYVSFMEEVQEYIKRARVVYLDPPYSQGHYSRFYHILETLVLYDYPRIAHAGRYRDDRHQSPFAHKGSIAAALGRVCEVTRGVGTTLVISYSRGGIIPDAGEFIELLKQHYPAGNITLKRLKSEHSKLGQARRMKTEEYLFICEP